MSEKLKLLPCPFCKEKKEIYNNQFVSGSWSVDCLVCDAQGPKCKTEVESIKAWNKRS